MRVIATAALLAATSLSATASEYDAALQQFLDDNIRQWADSAIIVDAIRAQNQRTQGLSPDDILALDQQWRAEVSAGEQPTIAPVLSNATSDFLRQQVEGSGGAITEIFAMDAQGLNVAASSVTSDYWQGDEAKFTQTFSIGGHAVHLGDVEFDESSQSYQAQISISIADPASNEPIGALTVGVIADALM